MTTYPTFDQARKDLLTLYYAVNMEKDIRFSDAAKAAWSVQGMLQGMLISTEGEPSIVEIEDVGHKWLTDRQAVNALGTLLDHSNPEDALRVQDFFGGGTREDRLSDGLRAGLAKLLLPVILGWVTQWIASGGLAGPGTSPISTSPISASPISSSADLVSTEPECGLAKPVSSCDADEMTKGEEGLASSEPAAKS